MPELSIHTLCELYFVLAVGYNIVSQVRSDLLRRPLAATDPVFGILVMSVFYLIWSSGDILIPSVWNAFVILYLLLILRFGVIKHLLTYSAEVYSSRLAWFSAISINIFGVGVLALEMMMQIQ
ncbi:hypothetical protein [Emcibacter nanhaiensis]|uniref:Uncharacterized protein n=1 Tax=Emcibacter nanhaiensis TaxID=1505037 RepID=A0A501PJN3_9PROT|nr:hypothetical protein [Emcibacter nanhaiensis]TPD60242.1 hypothetical protein FIV46_09325 [Emcibacter nanhaiensis]